MSTAALISLPLLTRLLSSATNSSLNRFDDRRGLNHSTPAFRTNGCPTTFFGSLVVLFNVSIRTVPPQHRRRLLKLSSASAYVARNWSFSSQGRGSPFLNDATIQRSFRM